MKIALVILHADPARGGAERYTADVAAALAKRGHAVTLLAADFGEAITGVEFVPLAFDGITRSGKYGRFLNALDRHLDSRKYDIVHAMLPVRRCDVYHPHAGLAAEAMAYGHRKYTGSFKQASARLGNLLNLKRRKFAAVERKMLASSRQPVVLCLSQYIKTTVRKHYPLAEDRLLTLFNAVDLVKFDPSARAGAGIALRQKMGITSDQTAALIIAQDFVRKGLGEAITALAKVADPTSKLVVVGKDDSAPYHALAQRLGVHDRVLFTGSSLDPFSFYLACDFLVLPTRHDPCSLVVLEALAMGKPVISTVFNGACEIMQNGVHGFVLKDPGDTDAIAEAYRQLQNPATRAAMSAACLALRPRLSFDSHVDKLLAIYEKKLM